MSTIMHEYPDPSEVRAWKLWYSDGSTITSQEKEWVDVPHGVQILMIYFDGGDRQIISGDSLYFNPFLSGRQQAREGTLMDYEDLLALQEVAMEDDWRS